MRLEQPQTEHVTAFTVYGRHVLVTVLARRQSDRDASCAILRLSRQYTHGLPLNPTTQVLGL